MNKNIIAELYDGEIYPAEQIVPDSDEYKVLSDEIMKDQEYFMNVLEGEDSIRFDQLCENFSKMHSVIGLADFTCGFKLGMRFACAAFDDDNGVNDKILKMLKE